MKISRKETKFYTEQSKYMENMRASGKELPSLDPIPVSYLTPWNQLFVQALQIPTQN